MTIHRIREARRKTRPQEVTAEQRSQRRRAAEQTAESPKRETKAQDDEGLSLEDYEERVAPAMYARDAFCTDVELAIATGGDGASPERILEALEEPNDPDVATYTADCRGRLRLTCLNYGIDPETGEPDRAVQRAIAAALRAGHTEADALALAVLAAHRTIPDVLMRDDEFRQAVQETRC